MPLDERGVCRVCLDLLDLNVWCANYLATKRGRADTACQSLVAMVRNGHSAGLGPVQLVISWGMLNRLQLVFEREFEVPATESDALISVIADYAALGPAGHGPYLTLGGAGVMPLADPEDRHVLETALAGHADFLVTANLEDFDFPGVRTVERDRILEYSHGEHQVTILHPFEMVRRL